nr:MAG TPA: hypothetical protein [Caudoviricetes sp.]
MVMQYLPGHKPGGVAFLGASTAPFYFVRV